MKITVLALVLILAVLSAPAGYRYDNDYSVRDEADHATGIEVDPPANYSHGWGIVSGERYLVLLYGAKHFLATPKLRDFRLETDIDGRILRPEFDLGVRFYFRWDRDCGTGACVSFYWTEKAEFRIALDDRVVFSRQDARIPELKGKAAFEVCGDRVAGEFLGGKFDFALPGGIPERGYVAFDSCFSPGIQISFGKLTLTSDESPVKAKIRDWHVALSTCQGMQAPLVYDLAQYRYETGETEFSAKLSGGVMDYKPTYDTKGREWCLILEKLTDPFVRFETEETEIANKFIYNGMHLLYNRDFCDRSNGDARTMINNAAVLHEWPLERTWLFRSFPEKFTIAAGYGYALTHPWRFAENGPYEAMVDQEGNRLYGGASLRKGRAAIVIRPTPDSRILERVPTGVPRRELALRHAATCGYFSESTSPSFLFDISTRARDFAAGELAASARIVTVFGDRVEALKVERSNVRMSAGIRTTAYACKAGRPFPVGVYHFVVSWNPGDRPREETFVFEVLPDDPEGPCPPLASGLPRLYSIPNEIKDLESSALDPWADFAGVGHYYAIDQRYPIVGLEQHIDRFVPLYRRPWWTNMGGRNGGPQYLDSPGCEELVRRVNMLQPVGKKGTLKTTRIEFGLCYAYSNPFLMQILRDYTEERRPAFKVITPEKLKAHAEKGEGLTAEEFTDLFNTAWDDFLAYGRPRVAAGTQQLVDDLLAINPKLEFTTGGPYSIYVSHYKSPYVLKYNGYEIEKDPRVKANGGFFQFEDYHYSCDYPLTRAAYFVSGFNLHYPYSRPIYPEIYYQGWTRCSDGAVFNAHPMPGDASKLATTHQRRVVYQYCYGTPSYSNGKWSYWTGYGFHARNPERQTMVEFMYAWGKMLKNKPVRPLKAPYVVLDLDELSRHGDYLETEYNYHIKGLEAETDFPDVNNTAEEDLGYTYEQCSLGGYNTPVLTTYSELDTLPADRVEFVILPPIGKYTPAPVKAKIRALHAKGVNLLAFETVDGLEDLFGVKNAAERKVRMVERESFSHKLAKAAYAADGADVRLAGASGPGVNADIPLLFINRTATGTAVFLAVPPTVINRSRFRENFTWGQDTVSKAMGRAMKTAFAALAPAPAVSSERGEISAVVTEKGDYVAVINESTPLYGNTAEYPVSFRFTVSAPGIGEREVSADTKFSVVTRERDRLVIRAETMNDTAGFFTFTDKVIRNSAPVGSESQ